MLPNFESYISRAISVQYVGNEPFADFLVGALTRPGPLSLQVSKALQDRFLALPHEEREGRKSMPWSIDIFSTSFSNFENRGSRNFIRFPCQNTDQLFLMGGAFEVATAKPLRRLNSKLSPFENTMGTVYPF